MFKYLVILSLCILFSLSEKATSWDIKDVLKTYIKDNYPWANVEINEIQVSGEIPDAPPKSITVEKSPPGKTVFKLEFKNGEKTIVSTYIKAFDWVVMSRKALKKGHTLREEDLYLTTIDINRIPKGAILEDYQQVIGKQLVRSIVANTPILEEMLEEKTKIKKGHRVTLLASSPNLTVSAIGELKEDGYIGNYVRVINLSSKKIVQGVLIDENTVKVEY
jgi:flagella basal body P-ring formation protein FlgA